jgi:putative ABC transport system permease protein
VLRHGFWETRFGGDPQIVGKQILLNDKPFEIIGVMPRHFEFPYGVGDMWTPFVIEPRMKQDHRSHQLRAVGLLREGYTVAQVNAELSNISVRMQQQFPEQEVGRTTYAVALNDEYTRVAKNYVPMMIGSALLVLLIACSNVANLLLARAATRRKEMAVRLALGATRRRLIRQLLTESVLLALLGGLLGCALAAWGLEALSNGLPTAMSKFIPGWSRVGLNPTVLVFAASISVLTGILFGLAPAWHATNTNLNQTLKDGGSTGKLGRSRRSLMHHALVVSELALSLMLLIGAGLFVRSFIQILHADLGVKPASVVTMNLELPRDKYPSEELQRNLYKQLVQRIETTQGVTGAGAINLLPMSGNRRSGTCQIEGRLSDKGKEHYTQIRVATPGYFAAIGTDLQKGRLFDARDDALPSQVVVVNQAFADHYLLNDDVLGRWIQLGETQSGRLEIIGVVANAMKDEMVNVDEPGVYLPFAQHPAPQMNLVIRAPNAGEQIVPAMRKELAELDPRLALSEVKPMEQVISERRSPQALIMWLLLIFAVAALSMAAVGMYAVMAYAVTRRTHEIGVRMALGAESADVLKLILGRGLRLTAFGLGIGLAGAFALTRLMRNLLYDVSPIDPPTFLAVVVILTAFALMACYIPARRATRVDPLIAIRCE